MTGSLPRWRAAFLPWCRRTLAGAVLAFAAVSFTLGGSAAAWPAFLAAAAVLAVLAFLAGAAAASAGPLLRRAEVTAINLAFMLLASELTLRAWTACSGRSFLVQEGMEAWKLAPNRNYGGLFVTNSRGFVGREFVAERRPGAPRLAVVGDSFVVGSVRQERSWCGLLEKQMPSAELYNFGVVASSPREYLETLNAEVWRWSPDLVLLSVFVGNDIAGIGPLPPSGKLDPRRLRLWLFARRLAALGAEAWRRLHEKPADGLLSEPRVFCPMSKERHLYGASYLVLPLCRRDCLAAAAEPNWGEALFYLGRIVDACRQHGVPVAVVLHPDELQVSPKLLAEMLEYAHLQPAEVDLAAPQRRLMAFFAERGVPCLDLLPAFPRSDAFYIPRDTHYNEAGNALAAEKIGPWLSTLSWPGGVHSPLGGAERR